MVAFGLAGVAILSWAYLICMDWGMRHMDVGMQMVIMPAMEHWTAGDLILVFLMWAVMMVPAASPAILLFAEINRRRYKQQGTFVPRLGFSWERGGFSGPLFRGNWRVGVRGNLTRERALRDTEVLAWIRERFHG
jgi:hypothetical protein